MGLQTNSTSQLKSSLSDFTEFVCNTRQNNIKDDVNCLQCTTSACKRKKKHAMIPPLLPVSTERVGDRNEFEQITKPKKRSLTGKQIN